MASGVLHTGWEPTPQERAFFTRLFGIAGEVVADQVRFLSYVPLTPARATFWLFAAAPNLAPATAALHQLQPCLAATPIHPAYAPVAR